MSSAQVQTNPRKPLRLTAPLTLAADPQDGADALPRRFSGIAYSGERMPRWGGLVIELATLRVETGGMPLLLGHQQAVDIGRVETAEVGPNGLTVAGTLFTAEEPAAQALARKARAGAKYQMSVGIFDATERLVADGATIEVNGRIETGPVTVLHGAVVREVSIVALGEDGATRAEFFGRADPSAAPATPAAAPAAEEGAPMASATTPDTATPAPAAADDPATLRAQLATAIAERDAARRQLHAVQLAARRRDVIALFAELKRTPPSDEQVQPYLALADEAFAAVAADMRAAVEAAAPHAPAYLFAATGAPALAAGAAPVNPVLAAMQHMKGQHAAAAQ